MANVRYLVHDVDAALAFVRGPGGRQLLAEDPSGNPAESFEPQRA